MGRTILAVLVVGLVAWAGWAILGGAAGGGTRGSDAVAAVGSGPMAGGPGTDPARPLEPGTGAAPTATTGGHTEAGAIRALLAAGDAREAVAQAQRLPAEVLRTPPVAGVSLDAALALAEGAGAGPSDRTLRADAARRLLGRLAVEGAVPLSEVRERLDALNREVLLGGREVPGVLFRHGVKAGDTLDRLMKREWRGRVRAGYGAVLWINHIASADRLRAAPILVPEEEVRLLVRKGDHRLWVLLGEVPVRILPVGLGMNGRTPEGRFEIEELQPRPDYWPPGGKRVPFGHRDNPLGTRWLGFKDTPEAQGIGIHGTTDPSSIGKDLSLGCVRLLNADVEDLFTWVGVGTAVEIRP